MCGPASSAWCVPAWRLFPVPYPGVGQPCLRVATGPFLQGVPCPQRVCSMCAHCTGASCAAHAVRTAVAGIVGMDLPEAGAGCCRRLCSQTCLGVQTPWLCACCIIDAVRSLLCWRGGGSLRGAALLLPTCCLLVVPGVPCWPGQGSLSPCGKAVVQPAPAVCTPTSGGMF